MPDKKLTDSEIVKALECCGDEMGCKKGCPCFDPKSKSSHCTAIGDNGLEKLALDLINRLQEEKEALINGQETLQKYIADLQAENKKWQGGYMTQKQEIANLEIELQAMRGVANCYKAQVEEFKSAINCFRGYEYKIKTEAYKEFAKLLDNKAMFPHEINDDYAVGLTIINNLLKKLVGDNNAKMQILQENEG